MKNIFLLIIIFSFFACNNKQVIESQKEIIETYTLPEDAVPIVYRRHIYIPCEADSIQGNFVFDTGADMLYFDSSFYANNLFRKFYHYHGKLPGGGSGNPQNVTIIRDSVPFSFKNYNNKFSAIPVFLLKPILGDYSDGIIGWRAFSDKIMEINYFYEYVQLHNDFCSLDTTGYVRVNLKREKNRFFVPITVQINENITIQDYFIWDIGAADIYISSWVADKYNFHDNVHNKFQYNNNFAGVSGESTGYIFRAGSVEIGNYKLNDVVMIYSNDKSGAMASRDRAGTLGNIILDRFDIIIDFVNNDLYLKPNANYNNDFYSSNRGFTYKDRSKIMKAWIVSGLHKGSNAETAGLQINDKIIFVNDTDIQDIPFIEQIEFWGKLDYVTLLVLRNGEEKIIEFALERML